MKKLLATILSLLLLLSCSGCSHTKTFDVSSAKTMTLQSGNSGILITIADGSAMESISQNIGSVQWKRAGKSSDSTGWGYRLCWFDEYGSCIEDIVVSGSGQIQWNGYFYTAKGAAINTSLLDELLYQYSV
ncbi:MAG: hypothetical protein ACI4L5_01425 [Negativibacillus sp.]